jgi:hypothetical protein
MEATLLQLGGIPHKMITQRLYLTSWKSQSFSAPFFFLPFKRKWNAIAIIAPFQVLNTGRPLRGQCSGSNSSNCLSPKFLRDWTKDLDSQGTNPP